VQKTDNPSNRDSGSAGEWPWQRAYRLKKDPRQRVFESVAQEKADGSIWGTRSQKQTLATDFADSRE